LQCHSPQPNANSFAVTRAQFFPAFGPTSRSPNGLAGLTIGVRCWKNRDAVEVLRLS
jgi:hypothetical protein